MAWLGTKRLGEFMPLYVQCTNAAGTPTLPDACPTMKIYSGGALVLSRQVPIIDRYGTTALFGYEQPLSSAFSAGLHYVKYSWSISSTVYTKKNLDVFRIVAGGDSSGSVVSMFYLDRPDGNDFILAQLDSGALVWNRGPRIS